MSYDKKYDAVFLTEGPIDLSHQTPPVGEMVKMVVGTLPVGDVLLGQLTEAGQKVALQPALIHEAVLFIHHIDRPHVPDGVDPGEHFPVVEALAFVFGFVIGINGN